VSSVAFSPDGKRIVSGSHDMTVRIWDAATGQPIGAPITGHTGPVISVAFSPDVNTIVSGAADNTLHLWPTYPDPASAMCNRLSTNMSHHESPWKSRRLLTLETKMEVCRRNSRLGSRPRVVYSPEEKAAAVRMVRLLRAELGSEQGTVARVARQLGYGIESVRSWVRQADIDEGLAPGVSTAESKKVTELEQEIRELKRARF